MCSELSLDPFGQCFSCTRAFHVHGRQAVVDLQKFIGLNRNVRSATPVPTLVNWSCDLAPARSAGWLGLFVVPKADGFSFNRCRALAHWLSMIPRVKPEGMLFGKPVSTRPCLVLRWLIWKRWTPSDVPHVTELTIADRINLSSCPYTNSPSGEMMSRIRMCVGRICRTRKRPAASRTCS